MQKNVKSNVPVLTFTSNMLTMTEKIVKILEMCEYIGESVRGTARYSKLPNRQRNIDISPLALDFRMVRLSSTLPAYIFEIWNILIQQQWRYHIWVAILA